jgi:hypothetical protein
VVAGAICLALALLTTLRRLGGGRERPLDGEELRVLRRLSDRIRIEQGLPID